MSPSDEAAERFVDRFAAAWGNPEHFLDAMADLLAPDVRLVQPMMRPVVGVAAFRAEFTRLRKLFPDIRGDVTTWAARGDTVFIELRLEATVDGARVSWPLVDRVHLNADGRCVERISYFDPFVLLGAIGFRPRVWLRLWRAGYRPRLTT